ncbi:COG4270 Predicted membrane protein [Candidatus Nanopelagicaceae bacterium]
MNFIKRIPQSILGLALIFTGVGHLTTRRIEFQAQVPDQLQQWANEVVLASGVVEITLGLGSVVLWKFRVVVGLLTAAFFVAIFWGNISQFINGTDAFGLDTGTKRFVRLLFQPVLVAYALLSTGAWRPWRAKA